MLDPSSSSRPANGRLPGAAARSLPPAAPRPQPWVQTDRSGNQLSPKPRIHLACAPNPSFSAPVLRTTASARAVRDPWRGHRSLPAHLLPTYCCCPPPSACVSPLLRRPSTQSTPMPDAPLHQAYRAGDPQSMLLPLQRPPFPTEAKLQFVPCQPSPAALTRMSMSWMGGRQSGAGAPATPERIQVCQLPGLLRPLPRPETICCSAVDSTFERIFCIILYGFSLFLCVNCIFY
ncbi:hypothetical protein BS78_06G060200 [Paspalum vaginatum]|nr:hypothetical protein BS78_06G060200 [Paspalum vaginatum]